MKQALANAYKRRVAKTAFDGTALPSPAFLAVGDGGHLGTLVNDVNPNAAGLVNELLRKPLSNLVQTDLYSYTGTSIIASDELIGATLSEAALLDSNGNPIAFRNFAPKIKDVGETYPISVKVKF